MWTKEQIDELTEDFNKEISEELQNMNNILKDSIEQKMLDELKQINKNLEGVNTKLNTLIHYSISGESYSGEYN
jgi:hypothetical protein